MEALTYREVGAAETTAAEGGFRGEVIGLDGLTGSKSGSDR